MVSWVLVVEDDPDNRELLVDLLESEGYRVVSCESAAEADGVLDARGRPGLVVTDIVLPGASGTAFVAAMKARPGFETTPVVFLTGMDPATLDGAGAGAPILTKPLDLDALMHVVSQHCRVRETPRPNAGG